MKTIIVGMDGLTALQKVARALYIETKLTGNVPFASLSALVVLLAAARVKLENAIANSLDGGKTATFLKNEAEEELDVLVAQIAGGVQSIAGDNEALILSAGFEVRHRGGPIGPLPAPANLRADLTDMAGQSKGDWGVGYGALEYELERNDLDPMDPNGWKPLDTVTPSKYLDEGLASGSTHWYRVRARGTAGPSPWSDPAKGTAR